MAVNTMKVLVMYAGDYSGENDKGQHMEGCSVDYYFFGDNGEALAAVDNVITGPVGFRRAKANLTLDSRRKITVVPAIYDAAFGMRVGSDGKPVNYIQDLQYYCPVEIKALPVSAAAKK